MSDRPPTAHVYSPSQFTFYASVLKPSYDLSGRWPTDWVAVDDQTFEKYGASPPPEGMTRGADQYGQPIWVPIDPTPSPG